MQIKLGVLVFLLLTSFADAKVIKLSTIPIPLLVEDSEKGLFIHLTKEIARRNNYELNIIVEQPGKALLMYSNGQVDGFFPALDDSGIKISTKTVPFYYKTNYIFYRKGHSLKTIKDLEGKKVGLTFRYTYLRQLVDNRRIKFEYAENDIINMKKLAQGVIEAFVVEERSGLKALELSGVRNIEYDKSKPLGKPAVFYAFQDTAEGYQLAKTFSKTIEEMRKDGTLNRILKEK
ncbi:substrate-binding periplasmic protein [Bdellovibrio sp.]|uniref:substrate-binding periplasmic protein n=1 Tax=Bdellovibrio sp. TaxID=28201 RepID=UPI0039E4102D